MNADTDVEQHNRRVLWEDCEARFDLIMHELGEIEGLLEDLGQDDWGDIVAKLTIQLAAFATAAELRAGVAAT